MDRLHSLDRFLVAFAKRDAATILEGTERLGHVDPSLDESVDRPW
jgi:hypothetical protein